ncbi:MAG: hypothetical protein HYS88_01790 [Candidatus Colwellbacteria bacterium]|nr:hypothetical protein [Candidatus Colwellbacteria bacterium]
MTLNRQKLALASAATFGVAYVVCVLFVIVAPDLAIRFTGWLFHLLNVEQFAGDVAVTAGGFIGGLVQVVVYAYLIAWLFAWFYNRFAGQKS